MRERPRQWRITSLRWSHASPVGKYQLLGRERNILLDKYLRHVIYAPAEYREYKFKRMVLHLVALLAHLKIDRPVIVVGHDFGTLPASRLALYEPARVKALILLSIGYRPPGLFDIDKTIDAAPRSNTYARWRPYSAKYGCRDRILACFHVIPGSVLRSYFSVSFTERYDHFWIQTNKTVLTSLHTIAVQFVKNRPYTIQNDSLLPQ